MSVEQVEKLEANPTPKPAPQLRDAPLSAGRFRALADMLWLVREIVTAAPLHSVAWAGLYIFSSLLIPVNLWIMKHLIDRIALVLQGSQQAQTVYPWLGMMAAGLLIERVVNHAAPWSYMVFREVIGKHLTGKVIEKSPRLPLEAFEHTGYYDELHRATQGIEWRTPELLRNLLTVVRDVPTLVAFGLMIATVSPILLVFEVIAAGASIAVSVFAGQDVWSVIRQQSFERRLADYHFHLLTSREHAKELRLYRLGSYLIERWSQLYWKAQNEQRRAATRAGIRMSLTFVFSVVTLSGGIIWIALFAPELSAGTYVIVIQAMISFFNTSFGVAYASRHLGEHAGFASDLRSFWSLKTEDDPLLPLAHDGSAGREPEHGAPAHKGGRVARPFPSPMKMGIRFENVTFTYPGGTKPVLSDISFHIAPGEKIALVGVNGAGKSTLAKLLLGLYRPDAGKISADGIDYREIDQHDLRKAVSVVMQHFVRYKLNATDNIALASGESYAPGSMVERAAMRADAHGLIQSLPQGYETILSPDMDGVDLSGGQWQKIALARGYYRQAQLVMLDEPTAALDPEAELEVFRRFRDLAGDKAALMISHRLGMARLADRVIVLHDGRIIEDASHDELMKMGGTYASLFHAQARWYQ